MANQLNCYTKSFSKRTFVIALFVMIFTAGLVAGTQNPVPGDGEYKAGRPDPVDVCRYEVTGCVTYTAYRTIVLDDATRIKTPIAWTLPQVGSKVWIKYWINPDGVKVACSMAIIGTCL